MKIEIKSRWSTFPKWTGEAESMAEAVVQAIKDGSDLRGSDLSGSNLSDSNLSGSNLRHSNLSACDLSACDLSDSNLSGSNLSGSNLSGSNLSGSDLRGCRGIDAIPSIPDLDGKILAAIKSGGQLDMSMWHTCQTTHCRAGWAITLAGDAGRVLEWAIGASAAGALIYARSYPELPVPNFHASNTDAMADIESRASLVKGGVA